mgnify:CR=1 FL=1
MIDPRHKLLDVHSVNHALHHFKGKLVKKFLRALRQAKRKLIELDHLLESLVGDGDPGNDKLAALTNYQPNPNHPDFVSDQPSPGARLLGYSQKKDQCGVQLIVCRPFSSKEATSNR